MSQREPSEQPQAMRSQVWRKPIQSLPTRIGFFVLAATLCTSLAITGTSVGLIDTFLREAIEDSFPVILERTAAELDTWYARRETDLQTFAASTVLNQRMPEWIAGSDAPGRSDALAAVAKDFQRLLADTPEVSSVFLRGDDGELVLWQGPKIEISRRMHDEIGRPGFSRAGYSRGRYIQVASTQLEGDGFPTLHLVIDLEQLGPILKSHCRGSTERISIVGADRQYLASSSGRNSPKAYSLSLAASDAPSSATASTGPAGERLIRSTMALTRFEHLDWRLVIEDEFDLAFSHVAAATQKVLGINLTIVAIIALIAYRISVALVRPIEALSAAALRISQGEMDVEIPESDSPDEVGLLTIAISEMKNRLDANTRELEAAHRNVEEVNVELRSRNEALHRANEFLARLSITDALTQLHNHRFFQDSMVKEAKRADRTGESLALILIDIDHFKDWNDRLGHAGGDEILRRIARLMSDLLRTTDILARYGGEEFALVAPGTSLDGAVQLAEKMRTTIGETQLFLDPISERKRVTVSIGVALYRGDRERLFSDADQALYRAKAAGRDCVLAFEELESPDSSIS